MGHLRGQQRRDQAEAQAEAVSMADDGPTTPHAVERPTDLQIMAMQLSHQRMQTEQQPGHRARTAAEEAATRQRRRVPAAAEGAAQKKTRPEHSRIGARLTWGVWSRWHARNKDRGRLTKDLLAPRLWRQDRGGTIHE